MVEKMIQHLQKKSKIDFLFFTGDLVFNGEKYEDFELAHHSLFGKFVDKLKIPLSNIVFVPGNHDVNRKECINAVSDFFDNNISESDILYDFYNKKPKEYALSLNPSGNAFNYLRNFYSKYYSHIDELYQVKQLTFDDKLVSIVSINSAWLSNGFRDDINKLMFPLEALKNTLQLIKSSELKIILVHHPLTYFKEFNLVELEDFIYKEFDCMFSGHIHREQIAAKFAGQNGIFCNSTQATLTYDKTGEIGYSVIDIDLENKGEYVLERTTYSKKENAFIDVTPIEICVPIGQEKARKNRLRNKITSKYRVELRNANELLLEYDEDKENSFLDSFTKPILSTQSGAESTTTDSQSNFNFDNFYTIDQNYLVFGNDKSGKTTILKKIQLHYLKHYTNIGKIPFYINYKELELKESQIDVHKLFKNYYEISNSEAEELLKNGNIILLIDNLNTSSAVNHAIINFLEKNKNMQFIICSDFLASRAYFEEIDHLNYTKLYFKDLTRKEIRIYSSKKISLNSLDKEDILERIDKMLQQLQLPVNFWTISLILLIYKKSADNYNSNLFEILDACVDEILQKKQLALTKSKLSFDQLKDICSRIAFKLLKDHKSEVYSATSVELINFIDGLIKQNVRLVGDAKEILDYLVQVGILKERMPKFTFRLNGLFEYFLAYYINKHPDVKEEILSNDDIYLVFKNELEIYSGLNRKDEAFLLKVYEKTRKVFDPIIEKYSYNTSLDVSLLSKLEGVQEIADQIKKIQVKGALSHEAKDLVKDTLDPLDTNSEVQLKKSVDSSNLTPEILETYLLILSRIFKNCDDIDNLPLVNEVFSYLLESHICFGYHLVDEFANISNFSLTAENSPNENHDIAVGKKLIHTLSNFIPVITQTMLFDGIGHANIGNIITNHIEELKKNNDINQYKLYILFFLMIDLDIKTNKTLINDVFDLVTLGPLKVSTLFKLNFYLAFKSFKNKELENFLKNKIRDAQIRIDYKSNSDLKINKELSKKQKAKIVRKNWNLK